MAATDTNGTYQRNAPRPARNRPTVNIPSSNVSSRFIQFFPHLACHYVAVESNDGVRNNTSRDDTSISFILLGIQAVTL